MKITDLAICFMNLKDNIINLDVENDIDRLNIILTGTESDILNKISTDGRFVIESDINFEIAKANGSTMIYANTYIMLNMYFNLLKPITQELFRSFGYFLYIHNVLLTY